MVTSSPPIPDGRSPQAIFMKWARDAILHLSRTQEVPGARTMRTTRGTAIIPTAAVRSQSGSEVGMYQLMSVEADWLVCRTLSIDEEGNRTVGETDIYIAKPFKLRNQIVSETFFEGTVDEEVVAYEYTTPTERIANPDDDPETQVVVPYYLPHVEGGYAGDTIYADSVNTGVWREFEDDTAEQLTLLDRNGDGRAWALKFE